MGQGVPRTWYKKFNFIIECDGIAVAGFQTCTGLGMEVANVEHKQGGDPVPYNSPGTVSVDEITMTRGLCEDFDLFNWFKDTIDVATGRGLKEENLYRTFDVIQLDRNKEELERTRVTDAYCRRYEPGDFDMDADENRIEKVVIKCRYWDRVPAA